jgi:hypothetical protein
MSAKNPRLFAIENSGSEAAVFSAAIRRSGRGVVRAMVTVRHLACGVLHVALQGAPEGEDWSDVAVWQAPSPGCYGFGDVATRFPRLRLRTWLEKPARERVSASILALAEFSIVEAAPPDADDPSGEIAS